MSKENNIVPELRFPEFEEEGEWSSKKLGDVAAFLKGKGIGKADIAVNGVTPCIRYGELYTQYSETIDEVTSSTNIEKDDLVLSQANDVIIPASGETRIDIATASCVLNAGVALGSDLNIIRSKLNGVFLAYYLNNGKKAQIAKMAQGVSVIHLYSSQLKSLDVDIPTPQEQQKIADCLSSLDALIAAHRDKLDALRLHKKGLMQNLFPQEGERVPRYRFEGFEGAWESSKFSDHIKLYRGSSPRPIKNYLTQDKSGVNWIKIGDTSSSNGFEIDKVAEKITKEGAKKSREVRKGELILANSMSYGKTYQINIDGCIYDGWFVLREYEGKFDTQFLLQLLNSDYMQHQYQKFAAGGIVQNISSQIVYSTTLPRPSIKEQQKIADCLSSVDELIAAQTERINQLQEHKRGLMQGLFPKNND